MKTNFSFLRIQVEQIVFCMTLAIITLVSCEKEVNPLAFGKTKEQISYERFQKRLNEIAQSKKEVTIEHATLEEINKVMRENGMKEFTKKDVERSVQMRTTYPCATWVTLGDWSGNSVLAAGDLVLAIAYICDKTYCGGNVDMFNCSGNCPSQAYDFAYMSGLAYGDEWDDLNPNDVEAAGDRILGLIACN